MVFSIPTLRGSRSASPITQRNLIQQGKELLRQESVELKRFDVVLSDLRNNLKAIEKLGLEVTRADRKASDVSSASMDLSSSDSAAVINTVANLSGISSGDFTINSTSISVDITVDSLDDVITRINDADAGATASLDAQFDYLTVTSGALSNELTLDDDTSGFFTAMNITPGTVSPVQGDSSLKYASRLQGLFDKVGEGSTRSSTRIRRC